MPPCDTARLHLREMADDDLDDMSALLGDPRVMEYYPRPKDRTEAALACLDYARELEVAAILTAIIHRDNRPSRRVAEKLGMQRNPELRHKSPVHEVFSLDL